MQEEVVLPIPQNITRQHALQAIKLIQSEGVPIKRESTKFDLVFESKHYPPKVVLSYANVFANGETLHQSEFSGGDEANRYLAKLGFQVIQKAADKATSAYTPHTVETAHLLLPHLIHFAQLGQTVTYGQVAKLIGKHHRVLLHPLGYIRDEICAKRGLPLLNVIAVNTDTGLPGESFLAEGTSQLSKEEYQRRFQEHRDRVFAYSGWGDLLGELGLKPVEKSISDLNAAGLAYSQYLKRNGAGGEGLPHRALKEFVASNPEVIGIKGPIGATLEFLFISGDECDVVFDLGKEGQAVIEIKNGDEAELVKGVYQALKYRALMVAEKGQGKDFPVTAYLVAYTIPSMIAKLAEQFRIRTVAVERSRVLPEA